MEKQNVLEFVNELIHSYCKLRDVTATLRCMTDDVVFTGTESYGSATGKPELTELLTRNVCAFPHSYNIMIENPVVQEIGPCAAVVTEGWSFMIEQLSMSTKAFVTLCCLQTESGWKINNIHVSVSDIIGDKENIEKIVTGEAKKYIDEQNRYRTVLNILGLAYWEWSVADGYYYSEKYTKYAISDAPVQDGMSAVDYAQYVHPDDIKLSNEYLSPPTEGEHIRNVVMRAKMKDGSYRWTEVYSVMDVGKDGELNRIISIMRDIDKEWQKQVRQREKLIEQTRHDALTGLYNKETFGEMVKTALTETHDLPYALIFMDIDLFKRLNDTLGHLIGDKAICDVANKLKIIFSNYDLICRFGGDEFCIFVRNIPNDTLRGKMDWLIEKMHEPFHGENAVINITVSCGIACTDECGSDYEKLMDCADKALYMSKNTGRDKYTFYCDIAQ